MFALTLAVFTTAISFVIVRWATGRTWGICAFLMAWLIGISLAVLFAAVVRGPGTGGGVEGEHVDASRQAIVLGFWFSLLGAAIGVCLGSLFRYHRR